MPAISVTPSPPTESRTPFGRQNSFLGRLSTGGEAGLVAYQAERDSRVRGLLDVTDKISSFDWDLEEVKEDHLALSREMKAQVQIQRSLDA